MFPSWIFTLYAAVSASWTTYNSFIFKEMSKPGTDWPYGRTCPVGRSSLSKSLKWGLLTESEKCWENRHLKTSPSTLSRMIIVHTRTWNWNKLFRNCLETVFVSVSFQCANSLRHTDSSSSNKPVVNDHLQNVSNNNNNNNNNNNKHICIAP